MRKTSLVFPHLIMAAALLAVGSPVQAQQAAPERIAGAWNVEVYVENEVFYLSLELQAGGGGLEGTVSEAYGSFTDVPIAETVFDGANLSFKFTAPTPPDGMERNVQVELKVLDEARMEGMLNVPDLGIAGQVKAAKR